MDFRYYDLHGARVVELSADGVQVENERDAVDLIGAASAHRPDLIVIPARSLSNDFFRLKTRIAGGIIQKFLTYRLRLAIMGDIANHLSDSSALRDFVYECNSGSHVWFVTDAEDLNRRLQARITATGGPGAIQ